MHKSQAKISQLMKRTMTIGLLGAVLAVAVGFISTNVISAIPFLMAESDLSANESTYMIGHVEYTVRDADGEIKQYVQADNVIVEKGKDCSAQRIFNATDNSGTGNSVCAFSGDGFNFIAIGNGTTGSANPSATETKLTDDSPVGCNGGTDTCEMDRKLGTVTIDPTGPDTVATIKTKNPFTFTSTTIVKQSGLFDNASPASGNMFSLRDALAIPVTSTDTLAVTWKITLH